MDRVFKNAKKPNKDWCKFKFGKSVSATQSSIGSTLCFEGSDKDKKNCKYCFDEDYDEETD